MICLTMYIFGQNDSLMKVTLCFFVPEIQVVRLFVLFGLLNLILINSYSSIS